MTKFQFWALVLNAWNVGVQTMGFAVDVATNDVGLLSLVFLASLILSVVLVTRLYPKD